MKRAPLWTTLDGDAISGILLVAAATLALVIANSPWDYLYESYLNLPVSVHFGAYGLEKPLILWVNDGLMAIFFFLVGLEVKREFLTGHLASKEQVILPAVAAVAGIVAPAFIYALFTYQDPIAVKGWAIPSATDIAFALGIFALFGKSLPISLKLFLLSVAIFDDIGAIVIIALFYSQDLSTTSLLVASTALGVLFFLNHKNVQNTAAYLLIGLIVWVAVLKSGVHATLAGFLVAWFIPTNREYCKKIMNSEGAQASDQGKQSETSKKIAKVNRESLLERLERDLHPCVAFFILPIFAFSNAGVSLQGVTFEVLTQPITLGIALGLIVGKQIGIFSACWLAVKCGFASLPKGTDWKQLYGVAVLCGIGFTMSLFVGSLAFEHHGTHYQDSVKLGVLLGSIASAILGAYLISGSKQKVRVANKPGQVAMT